MIRRLRRFTAFPWLALLLLACLSCQVPIRTLRVRPEDTYRDLDVNAVSEGKLSQDSRLVLTRLGLAQEFESDPVSAIRKLNAAAIAQPIRVIRFALAEACYVAAKRGYGQDNYLAAAVYAYLYLFETDTAPPPNPYGRSFGVARDLYNRALLEAFSSPSGQRFVLSSGHHQLPFGRLQISAIRSGFQWSEESFNEFIPADNVRVIGLSSRRRYSGLGVPLIAVMAPTLNAKRTAARVPPGANVAATAFLRFEGGVADLQRGASATLELYSAFDVPTVQIGGRTVPLEVDLTAPLAKQLGKARAWSMELAAFFRSDDFKDEPGMWMLQPYRPGKIPVVFVHGTASSPARWAEMFNELNGDPDLRAAYQFWFFTYTTGNPILYSAALLRDSLTDVIQQFDPEGRDPSLRNMVLIGHSQGGILAKLQAIHSGDVFWKNVVRADFPIDQVSADDLQYIRRLTFIEPQPAVKRLVFISTPQRGSFVAGGWMGRLMAGFVSIPANLTDKFTRSIKSPDLLKKFEREIPTSVANMTPNHPFVTALSSVDVTPGIHTHSIIAVNGDGPPDELDDGVVQYKSAHLEDADSELVVRSGHSCQANPQVIQEVRRILLEHLRQSGKLRP